jgi:hypothetical protein
MKMKIMDIEMGKILFWEQNRSPSSAETKVKTSLIGLDRQSYFQPLRKRIASPIGSN